MNDRLKKGVKAALPNLKLRNGEALTGTTPPCPSSLMPAVVLKRGRPGAMYANGLGAPRDTHKAREYFSTGSTMGDPDASTNFRRFCGR
jgi:hypothetical protein